MATRSLTGRFQDMSDTPLWLQVTIPAATLMGGFTLGRLSSRLDRRQATRDAVAARAPRFVLTHESGSNYRLTNDGDMVADDVRVDPGGYPLTRDLPDGISLRRGESCIFTIFRAAQVPDPVQFFVTWRDCPESQVLPVPRPGT
jgi:hypothetical protein